MTAVGCVSELAYKARVSKTRPPPARQGLRASSVCWDVSHFVPEVLANYAICMATSIGHNNAAQLRPRFDAIGRLTKPSGLALAEAYLWGQRRYIEMEPEWWQVLIEDLLGIDRRKNIGDYLMSNRTRVKSKPEGTQVLMARGVDGESARPALYCSAEVAGGFPSRIEMRYGSAGTSLFQHDVTNAGTLAEFSHAMTCAKGRE